jgi:tetratricopeptide (TPR) repeat protein
MSVIEKLGRPLEIACPAWQSRAMRAYWTLAGFLPGLASSAALADSPIDATWRLCLDEDRSAAVSACSSIIATGGGRLAEAHYHRANVQRMEAQRARATGQGPAGSDTRSLFDPALADYDAAIRLRPDYAEAYVNRGVVHYDKGDYDRAIADNDAAIRLKPDFAEAFNNRSLAWYKKGDYARAQADFDRTIKLKQNYGNALIMRPVGSSAEPLG